MQTKKQKHDEFYKASFLQEENRHPQLTWV
jgi:hypothetical protein